MYHRGYTENLNLQPKYAKNTAKSRSPETPLWGLLGISLGSVQREAQGSKRAKERVSEMWLNLSLEMERKLERVAKIRGVTAGVLLRVWVSDILDERVWVSESGAVAEPADTGEPTGTPSVEGGPRRREAVCLVPLCGLKPTNRGLCTNHYQRIRYYESKGYLNEGWCVRHLRMWPRRGRTREDYAIERETLETLPRDPPTHRYDTRWFFNWPVAQAERAKILAAVDSIGSEMQEHPEHPARDA